MGTCHQWSVRPEYARRRLCTAHWTGRIDWVLQSHRYLRAPVPAGDVHLLALDERGGGCPERIYCLVGLAVARRVAPFRRRRRWTPRTLCAPVRRRWFANPLPVGRNHSVADGRSPYRRCHHSMPE